jgi:hypothetical protein
LRKRVMTRALSPEVCSVLGGSLFYHLTVVTRRAFQPVGRAQRVRRTGSLNMLRTARRLTSAANSR